MYSYSRRLKTQQGRIKQLHNLLYYIYMFKYMYISINNYNFTFYPLYCTHYV